MPAEQQPPTDSCPRDLLVSLNDAAAPGALRQYSTLREWAYHRLRTMIITGVLPPGADLHEDRLCLQLNISKSPLREALRQLAQEGLVIAISNKGSYVAPITLDDVREIFTLRSALETLQVRLAASRITPQDIATLRTNIGEMEAAAGQGDWPVFAEKDVAFHLLLARIAGHRRLLRIQESLQAEMLRLVILHIVHFGLRPGTGTEHHAIVDALAIHDADLAEARMRQHLERASAWYYRAFEQYLAQQNAQRAADH